MSILASERESETALTASQGPLRSFHTAGWDGVSRNSEKDEPNKK